MYKYKDTDLDSRVSETGRRVSTFLVFPCACSVKLNAGWAHMMMSPENNKKSCFTCRSVP